MTLEEINEKKVELREEIENAETTEKLEELKGEVEALNNEIPEEVETEAEEVEEVKEEKAEEEISKEEERSLVRDTQELETRSISNINIKGENKMEELRNSKEYINAYAEYVKGNEKELRALTTENVSGDVAVPELVYDIVKTNWEKDDIMSLVKKISVKGNLKVNFEVSGGEATVHTEGGTAVTEEELVLGIVELKPESIKKWISISDEVFDMRGEEFLRYIYDELTQKIVKKAKDELIGKIAQLPQTATSSSVSANEVELAPALGTIATAIANLNDEATDYTIVMNKLTYADFKNAQYNANYGADIFEGARVRFSNALPSYASASDGDVYAIVGDFSEGALANYPNGRDVDLKFDDKTEMTKDMIRILGRQYVAVAPISDKAFALITKPSV